MPRPKTKGDPIQFRLPIGVDTAFRQQCDERGITIAEALTRYATEAAKTTRVRNLNTVGGSTIEPRAQERAHEYAAQAARQLGERDCQHPVERFNADTGQCTQCGEYT